MDYWYAKQNLYRAMYSLATGKGDVRSRLESAYRGFYVLEEYHFPDEFRSDWQWGVEQLKKFGPLYDNSGTILIFDAVEHTMSRIRKKTGQAIASKIFDIGWALHNNEEYR